MMLRTAPYSDAIIYYYPPTLDHFAKESDYKEGRKIEGMYILENLQLH